MSVRQNEREGCSAVAVPEVATLDPRRCVGERQLVSIVVGQDPFAVDRVVGADYAPARLRACCERPGDAPPRRLTTSGRWSVAREPRNDRGKTVGLGTSDDHIAESEFFAAGHQIVDNLIDRTDERER
jgi:hypothetical protein